jgi:hypothetical protein
MKTIEVTEQVHAELNRLAAESRREPSAVLAALLHLPTSPDLDRDPLIAFLLGSELRTKSTDAERYVAVLSWVAERQPARFRDYVQSLTSGRRYLGLNREEIIAQCHHNQARPIPGTTFWAIMNLDTPTKRRFLRRVLTFCGYPPAVVEFAVQVFGRPRLAQVEDTAAA